jgi:cytochrome c biogenesis protein CcdA/thioredoxin-related protein
MKSAAKILLYIVVLFQFTAAAAQDSLSVKWELSSERKDSSNYLLVFKAVLPIGFHVYFDSTDKELMLYPQISFADASIEKNEALQLSTLSRIYQDPLFDNRAIRIVSDSIMFVQSVQIKGVIPSMLKGNLSYTIAAGDLFTPETFNFSVTLQGGTSNVFQIKRSAIDLRSPISSCGDEGTGGKSSWVIFLLGLAGGFVALLTPCVFPLIPLTVSFFTKKATTRKQALSGASLYGFFILIIYLVLSLPFHLLDTVNPEILNNISTNTWLNIAFFLIFIIFAISFFGYFEITLPSKFATGADAKSGMGSMAGIFFMALTLAIVSFSCTGPILGSLLAGALTKEGGAWQLTAGMGGFGLGLALPFALFALFPRWLHSLPKSGGWLNTVKVVLGFLELGMALKFLSNADLVEQWGILKREVFIGLWALISLLIVLYLLGWIRFPHDGSKIAVTRSRAVFIGVFAILFIYLTPGVTNSSYARLSVISGFPPPLCYSVYEYPVNCKHEIEPLRDYNMALALAKKTGKPLLIDFTGWACVNCRKMEEQVWTDPLVRKLMHEELVVVSLYVDERKILPASQQQTITTVAGKQRDIITVGDQWAAFQSENFHAVAQPQYAMIGYDEKLLTATKGYTPDPDEFRKWLDCGIASFYSRYEGK